MQSRWIPPKPALVVMPVFILGKVHYHRINRLHKLRRLRLSYM